MFWNVFLVFKSMTTSEKKRRGFILKLVFPKTTVSMQSCDDTNVFVINALNANVIVICVYLYVLCMFYVCICVKDCMRTCLCSVDDT